MYLSIDLGGTYVKHAVIDEYGNMNSLEKEQTPRTREGLCSLITELSSAHPESTGIAISSPGSVWKNAIVQGSSAVRYIKGWNMKEELEKRTGKTVHVENDANCAGMAEAWKGAAQEKQDVLVVVIGTGIGGAIIKDRRIHQGAHMHGGEFGYMLLSDDIRSSDDVWSRKASTKALIRRVAAQKNMNPDELTGEEIFHKAENGDSICKDAVETFYHLLAVGFYNLQYVYDPDIILISGGISAREDLTKEINKRLDKILSKIDLATITPVIKPAHFRQNANLLGAAFGFMNKEKTATQP